MNSFAVVFLAALACASASIIAAPATRILQGPSSSATIVGPDGSAISSIAPGGQVITNSAPGIVAAAGPALLRSSILAPSVLAPAGLVGPGLVARSSLIAPSLLAAQGATIAGPSGVISTAGGYAAAPLAAALW